MNNEVIKAMNKTVKEESKIRKWWNKNSFKIMRIVFFPVWLGVKIDNEISHKLDLRNKWSEARADEILSYYIPRRAKWVPQDKEFFFFDNGFGWDMDMAKKYLKRKDRHFWKQHKGFSGGRIRQYLINTFELEGFKKTVIDDRSGRTEIIFSIIEE